MTSSQSLYDHLTTHVDISQGQKAFLDLLIDPGSSTFNVTPELMTLDPPVNFGELQDLLQSVS